MAVRSRAAREHQGPPGNRSRAPGTSRKQVSSPRDGTVRAEPGSAGGPLTSCILSHTSHPVSPTFLVENTLNLEGERTLGSRPSSDGDLKKVISPTSGWVCSPTRWRWPLCWPCHLMMLLKTLCHRMGQDCGWDVGFSSAAGVSDYAFRSLSPVRSGWQCSPGTAQGSLLLPWEFPQKHDPPKTLIILVVICWPCSRTHCCKLGTEITGLEWGQCGIMIIRVPLIQACLVLGTPLCSILAVWP